MTCAIYAQYSSDLQNQASIEDQLRLCRERAADHPRRCPGPADRLVVRRFNAAGEPIRGERVVNQTGAGIVRCIFNKFARGDSPKDRSRAAECGEDRGTVQPQLGRVHHPRPPRQRDGDPPQ
jgi:hypothetical protein